MKQTHLKSICILLGMILIMPVAVAKGIMIMPTVVAKSVKDKKEKDKKEKDKKDKKEKDKDKTKVKEYDEPIYIEYSGDIGSPDNHDYDKASLSMGEGQTLLGFDEYRMSSNFRGNFTFQNTHNDGGFAVATGGRNTQWFVFDKIGNLGVGVENPRESLHLKGALILGDTNGSIPGTIRWNGSEFLGFDGTSWISLTTSAETDPIFSASDAASITSTDIINWNLSQAIALEVQSWGNHADVGYLTSFTEQDGDATNELITSAILNGTILEITEAGITSAIDLSSIVNGPNADSDASNELNTGINLNGTTLEITDAGGTLSQDLSALKTSGLTSAVDPATEAVTVSNNVGTDQVTVDGDLEVTGKLMLTRRGDVYMGPFGNTGDDYPTIP